jgi:hypothetical protein
LTRVYGKVHTWRIISDDAVARTHDGIIALEFEACTSTRYVWRRGYVTLEVLHAVREWRVLFPPPKLQLSELYVVEV